MKKVNNKKGFTLAELLVVIAILAILVAIAVPIFGGAMDNAKKTAQDANARSLKSAGMVYLLSDDGADKRDLTGSDTGWEVKGTVDGDGDMTLTSVTPVALPADTTYQVTTSGGVDTYTVYMVPTDL